MVTHLLRYAGRDKQVGDQEILLYLTSHLTLENKRPAQKN